MPRRIVALVTVLMLWMGVAGQRLLAATGQLELTVVDKETGQPIACRMHLFGPNKKPRKPDKVPAWHDHFVVPGKLALKLPTGNYTFTFERGLEYLQQEGHFTIEPFADDTKQVEMQRFVDMSAAGWWSGDLDVRRPVRDMELLMASEDLHVAEVITWQNEKSQWGGQPPKEPLVRFDGNRYCHLLAGASARSGTELLLLHLAAPLKLPAAGVEYPSVMQYLAEGRGNADFWVDAAKPFGWDLPMLVAAGQIDSIELAHNHIFRDGITNNEAGGKLRDRRRYASYRGNAEWSQDIYFRLLECGLRIPPSAGSGSGLALNPVGQNRVYVHVDGEFSYAQWWKNLRDGRVFITNGPLMKPSVNGEPPGHVFTADAGQKIELEIGLTISTRDPITYLEIIKDGKVAHEVRFDDYAKTGKLPPLGFDRSGWFLIRAVADVPKTYRFAMTGPYYVDIGYQRRISKQAAQFFLDWEQQRAEQIQLADPAQQQEVLQYHQHAKEFWQNLASKANAE